MELFIYETTVCMVMETPIDFELNSAMDKLAKLHNNKNGKILCLLYKIQKPVKHQLTNGISWNDSSIYTRYRYLGKTISLLIFDLF